MKQQHTSYPYDYPAHDFEPMTDAPAACQICADFAAEADAERCTCEPLPEPANDACPQHGAPAPDAVCTEEYCERSCVIEDGAPTVSVHVSGAPDSGGFDGEGPCPCEHHDDPANPREWPPR